MKIRRACRTNDEASESPAPMDDAVGAEGSSQGLFTGEPGPMQSKVEEFKVGGE